MKNLIVINTQSFGDILLSTHIARLAKKYVPEIKVHFFIRSDLTLTTAENNPQAILDMINIIKLQDNITSVGVMQGDRLYPSAPIEDFQVLFIQGWSSDLGIVKSQLKPFYDMFNIKDPIDTETKFNVGLNKTLAAKSTIGIAGKLDFLRKWHNVNEYNKFISYMKNNELNVIPFGVDTSDYNYLSQLQILNCCDLLISPMGSLIHAAAGLNVNTISLTSVFPIKYDCPEFYHSGWHRSIKQSPPFHCGTYSCVHHKNYDNQQTWGNPQTQYGFWPENCDYTESKKSCNFSITADMLIEKFEEWLEWKTK